MCCSVVTVTPATVSRPARFALASVVHTTIEPAPRPSVGVALIQGSKGETVQLQPSGACTLITATAADAGSRILVGVTVMAHPFDTWIVCDPVPHVIGP